MVKVAPEETATVPKKKKGIQLGEEKIVPIQSLLEDEITTKSEASIEKTNSKRKKAWKKARVVPVDSNVYETSDGEGTASEYDETQDLVKREVMPWHSWERPKRMLLMYYGEQMLLIFDFLQICGLIWAMSLPWPWPSYLLRATIWILFFNFSV